jgi:hypothetical protein
MLLSDKGLRFSPFSMGEYSPFVIGHSPLLAASINKVLQQMVMSKSLAEETDRP